MPASSVTSFSCQIKLCDYVKITSSWSALYSVIFELKHNVPVKLDYKFIRIKFIYYPNKLWTRAFGTGSRFTCPSLQHRFTACITLINEFLIKKFQVAQNEHEFNIRYLLFYILTIWFMVLILNLLTYGIVKGWKKTKQNQGLRCVLSPV